MHFQRKIITYFKLRVNQNTNGVILQWGFIIIYFKLRVNQNKLLHLTMYVQIITYFKLRVNQNLAIGHCIV